MDVDLNVAPVNIHVDHGRVDQRHIAAISEGLLAESDASSDLDFLEIDLYGALGNQEQLLVPEMVAEEGTLEVSDLKDDRIVLDVGSELHIA